MTSFTLAAFKDRPRRDASLADCTFCQIATGSQNAHVVYSDQWTMAFLDILPIRKGHVLVVPRRHVHNLASLALTDDGGNIDDPSEAEHVMQTVVKVTRGLGRALQDDRLQVITNQGYAQIVPHLHFHIVPAPPLPGTKSIPVVNGKKRKNSHALSDVGSSAGGLGGGARNLLLLAGHGRDELDEDEAVELAQKIRSALEAEDQQKAGAGGTSSAKSKL